jgi:predicted 3-demethylubiquinone-9 3-methyltransferase (glyoxalase superfamily)
MDSRQPMKIRSKSAPCLGFDNQAEEPAKSARTMNAMPKMKKLDIAALLQACNANP